MDERDVAKKPMRNNKARYGMGYEICPSCKHLLSYEPCLNLTTLQNVQLEINKRVFDKLYSPTTTRGGQIKTRDIWEVCKMVESNRVKDEASALVFDGMEHWDSGINEYVIGLPTSEQREALKAAGFTMMVRDKYADGHGKYELWMR